MGTSPTDPEVIPSLARERWGLDFNNGGINLVQTSVYGAVDGVMSTLGPEVFVVSQRSDSPTKATCGDGRDDHRAIVGC